MKKSFFNFPEFQNIFSISEFFETWKKFFLVFKKYIYIIFPKFKKIKDEIFHYKKKLWEFQKKKDFLNFPKFQNIFSISKFFYKTWKKFFGFFSKSINPCTLYHLITSSFQTPIHPFPITIKCLFPLPGTVSGGSHTWYSTDKATDRSFVFFDKQITVGVMNIHWILKIQW